ncbi:helix-turn-helix domain-containing protein [Micromonospora carbonacea]|uniref:Helix-turn-helix transcriptional regulator n=1 Tax=Micromonospora carbonacea TaxID=47853 RepID=A0A7H8XLR0_9ACTN|nr:helix-turn-helix domain-containing protein [Micromonospora carbonacea]MBB5826202.1 transcriptional regulator with XRE-family HTH domain [Micromonospora carbonacea]QLD25754.1 helix-turn-helix transcriptional regulator [Micromonospora carbonacea]
MTSGDEPIGRRVARWRARRRLTQQMLADRLGRSKSWVDKVERGVRALDRYAVIQEVAEVLRVDPLVLLGERRPLPSTGAGRLDGVDGIRAALARYDVPHPTGSVAETGRHVGHAWLTFQHARYDQVIRLLPRLLHAAQGVRAAEPELLVQAYRIASSVLVKLGEADLGWLAADRAVAAAGGDRVLAGAATISAAQALRALGYDRLALVAALAAAHRIAPAPPPGPETSPEGPAVHGTLLLQAALAAAGCGDAHRAGELTARAAEVAARVAADDPHRTGFGPVVVELAEVVAAVELGEARAAVVRHEQVVRRDAWRLLPAEHRAAYLVDAARAYLQVGDPGGAGRALVDADGVAPAEVRCRPVARTVLAEVASARPAPAGVARLATLVGLSR